MITIDYWLSLLKTNCFFTFKILDMSTNVSVVIREIHRADVPGNTHYIASVQLLDGEDGWVSPAFPVDFHDKHELERKIAQEVTMYILAKQSLGKHIARGRWL